MMWRLDLEYGIELTDRRQCVCVRRNEVSLQIMSWKSVFENIITTFSISRHYIP